MKTIQLIKGSFRNTSLYKIYRRRLLIRSLKKWTVQDEEMLMFYSQFISGQALCFDVGANIGKKVKIFLELNAEVVAIEPQVECVETLFKAIGKKKNLKIVQTALGDKDGEADLMISDSNTLSSISHEWINAVKKSRRFSGHIWN